jgi:hypothetical protein
VTKHIRTSARPKQQPQINQNAAIVGLFAMLVIGGFYTGVVWVLSYAAQRLGLPVVPDWFACVIISYAYVFVKTVDRATFTSNE